MQAWARLIRKRGFNMAGKENQWDLRVEYGWGRCAHTHRQTHTHIHTDKQKDTHVFYTHTVTHEPTHTNHHHHHTGTCPGNYLQ